MSLKTPKRGPEPYRTDFMVPARVDRSQVQKRRSSRMALSAAVALSGEDRQKCAFTMPAKATNLNRHGAIVHLNRELLVGSVIHLQNKRGGSQISARVVTQLSALKGGSSYGIEFVEQDKSAQDFWGITFPSNNQ